MKAYLRFCLEEEKCFTFVAGVDEVGCGPLAGDVVAAAVILDPDKPVRGLRDSKQLDEDARERLYRSINTRALAWSIGRATAAEIDKINILQARLLAMHRAVQALTQHPEFVYVDGNRCPEWYYPSKAVIGGDNRIRAVAAASIMAKVSRDRELKALDDLYPGYGFAQHKGYSTSMHREALRRLGPSPIHRKTFGPVAELLRMRSRSPVT